MKLRQKLAVVLATAMVITAVPVTTMAQSTNTFNKTVSIVEGTVLDAAKGVTLDVEFAGGQVKQDKQTTFFVNATDFEFDKDAYTSTGQATGTMVDGDTTIVCLDKESLKVTTTVKAGDDATKINIPVLGKAKKGNPALTVDGEDSLATSGKYSLSGAEVVTDKVYTATADDATNISVDGIGTIADITIEEKVAGSFANDASGDVQFQITLPNRSDLDFDVNSKVEIEGKRGHAGRKLTAELAYGQIKDGKDSDGNQKYKDDKKVLIVTVKGDFSTEERGSIVIKKIGVQPEDPKADCKTGDLKVKVTEKVGKKADGKDEDERLAETELTVAKVAEFGVEITTVDDKKLDLVGGKGAEKIKVKIKESAIGSLDNRKDLYLTLDGAKFVEGDKAVSIKLNDEDAFEAKIADGEIHIDLQDIDRDAINTFEVEFEAYADVKADGPILLVAESKNFDEAIKTEIGKVAAPFKVEAEALTLKVGLQGQVGGKVTLAETDKERFEKGDVFYVISDQFNIDAADIKVTEGDLQIETEITKAKTIKVTIKRPSSEASTIEFTNFDVTTNRSVPEGKFDLVFCGEAISYMNIEDKPGYDEKEGLRTDEVVVEDFFVVGTKNTEDLPNAAAAKEIVLTVGATAYTVNGEAKTADVAAYIDENNRTMVPVKFIAEEFGKIDFGTVNGVGTVTVFKDGAVLQFQNGSNVMNKNGIAIPMDTAVVIKDGRTFVPFKYVADGLGINYSFDAATKSITFTNQAK